MQKIGRHITLLLGLLFGTVFVLFLYAETLSLVFFTAQSQENAIILEWRTYDETNIVRFEVERKREKESQFHKIGELPAKGFPATYHFTDADAFQKRATQPAVQGTVYQYRLKAIRNANLSPLYSETITVTHTVSSFRRTWGMIKELFR